MIKTLAMRFHSLLLLRANLLDLAQGNLNLATELLVSKEEHPFSTQILSPTTRARELLHKQELNWTQSNLTPKTST